MWKVFVVQRLSWRRRKRYGHFKDQEMDCGACKQIVGEVDESLSTWSGGLLCCKPNTQHCKILRDVVYIFYTGEVVVIMVTVIIVAVVLEIIVVVIVGVVIVVIGGWAYAFHQDKASLVRVPVANVTLSSSVHLLRENTDSVRSNQWMSPIAPSVPMKIFLEQSIAAINGYRGGSGGELETSMEDVEGVCGAATFMEKKEEMWPF
nr:hypothetical protein [Tanacetum cinerariifolium]